MPGQAGGNAQDAGGGVRLWSGQESSAGDVEFGEGLHKSDRNHESVGMSSGRVGEQLEPALGAAGRQWEE